MIGGVPGQFAAAQASDCASVARIVARARVIGAEAALAAGDRGDAGGRRVDRWWRDAEHRAGVLIVRAGEHGETLRRYVAARFAALGR